MFIIEAPGSRLCFNKKTAPVGRRGCKKYLLLLFLFRFSFFFVTRALVTHIRLLSLEQRLFPKTVSLYHNFPGASSHFSEFMIARVAVGGAIPSS